MISLKWGMLNMTEMNFIQNIKRLKTQKTKYSYQSDNWGEE